MLLLKLLVINFLLIKQFNFERLEDFWLLLLFHAFDKLNIPYSRSICNLLSSFTQTRPVAFAVRANYGYNGAEDDDSPVHGMAVSFDKDDCLHIKDVRKSC